MKAFTFTLFFAAMFTALACNQPSKNDSPVEPKVWDYVITTQTSKQSLDSLTNAWAKDSITLNFTKMEFDGAGNLFKIDGTVDIISMGRHVNGRFSQDSLGQKPLEIKMDNRPGVYIGIKK